jgi:hypothetical protein
MPSVKENSGERKKRNEEKPLAAFVFYLSFPHSPQSPPGVTERYNRAHKPSGPQRVNEEKGEKRNEKRVLGKWSNESFPAMRSFKGTRLVITGE